MPYNTLKRWVFLMRLLLAEDDLFSGEMLARQLQAAGYFVDWVQAAEEAIKKHRENQYDLLILDWMLPDIEGMDVCRQLRADGDYVPIIILTSRVAVVDRVTALTCGADDYMCKPCLFPELLARVRSLIQRANGKEAATVVQLGKLKYCYCEHAIDIGTEKVYLSNHEALLFELLVKHIGQPISRKCVALSIWNNQAISTGAVDPLINQLRRRLKPIQPLCSIKNERGRGYLLSVSD
jgi:DNA-binding response OmpR family regulator